MHVPTKVLHGRFPFSAALMPRRGPTQGHIVPAGRPTDSSRAASGESEPEAASAAASHPARRRLALET